MNKKKIATDLIIGFVIMAGVSWYRGLFKATGFGEVVGVLSDGAFVAAVVIGGLACLKAVRNEGVFDGLMFTVRNLFSLHWPSMFGQYRKDFAAYRDAKKEKRTSAKESIFVGGLYLAAAVLCIALYLFM